MAKKKYYGIKSGRKNNIVVGTWDECFDLVNGHPGAIFKSFPTHSQALDFAEGIGQAPPKKTKPAKTRRNTNEWDNEKYPCIERKTYRDTATGILYKNRCVCRAGPTTTGVNYKPSDDTSVPW